jgi:hypothetical protein
MVRHARSGVPPEALARQRARYAAARSAQLRQLNIFYATEGETLHALMAVVRVEGREARKLGRMVAR